MKYLLGVGVLSQILWAAPMAGDRYELSQPNGQKVSVKVWGDEYYQRVESLDGYTLVQDESGWINFADLQADGSKLFPTGEIYHGSPGEAPQHHKKSLMLSPDARRLAVLNSAIYKSNNTPQKSSNYSPPVNSQAVTGDVVGLTILIDFSDQQSQISRQEIDDFMNKKGYNGYACNGSVNDYFKDVSGGKVNYKNKVFDFYRASQPKTYYDANVSDQSKVQNLIKDALVSLGAKYYDYFLDSLTKRNGVVVSLNVLYAGTPDHSWGFGLWPHQSSLGNYKLFDLDNVIFDSYQITNIGTDLNLDVICHENGHMVFGWPDLYDRMRDGSSSSGLGNHCLMGFKGSNPDNPSVPNGYLRYLAGWEQVTELSKAQLGSRLSIQSNSNQGYIYRQEGGSELFYIESRQKTGRSASAPDEGLMIWHVDPLQIGNDYEQMTSTNHYMVSLEQADGKNDLERSSVPGGDGGDLFKQSGQDSFSDLTTPNAHWWNSQTSALKISNISAPGAQMSFDFGDPTTTTQTMEFPSGRFSVKLTNRDHGVFLHWENPQRAELHFDLVNIKGDVLYSELSDDSKGVLPLPKPQSEMRILRVKSSTDTRYFYLNP